MANQTYPQFNLKTIQLPIPSVTMTKDEYKDAFGIDLDQVDLSSVVLLWDGKKKYVVDEVKEDLTGTHIYAGGKILDIDSSISVTDNAYSVENAKPVYCHPIRGSFTRQDNMLFTFTCLIFNNSSTAFTTSTFFDWILALFEEYPDASIMASGYIDNMPISRIYKGSGSSVFFEKPKLSDGVYVNDYNSMTLGDLNTGSFVDGVNKIN